ncbi:MAG: hypothetical protein NTY38_14305 [Acidobacteria bacterium]|nr:hypothetical protein [Acidobacteriota bacterium]
MKRYLSIFVLVTMTIGVLPAQVNSPRILMQGGIDASSVNTLAQSICLKAKAKTPREKSEAIWRFFLTDGRFVPPARLLVSHRLVGL